MFSGKVTQGASISGKHVTIKQNVFERDYLGSSLIMIWVIMIGCQITLNVVDSKAVGSIFTNIVVFVETKRVKKYLFMADYERLRRLEHSLYTETRDI